MQIDLKQIGLSIAKIRKRLKITQRQLAQNTNLTVTCISMIECGLRKPSLDTLQKIGKALDFPFPLLLVYTIESNNEKIQEIKKLADCIIFKSE